MIVTFPMPLSPADSARAVAQVYSTSVLATLPLALAGAAAIALRRASAGARVLVWRGAAVALVAVWLGNTVPLHRLSIPVGEILATPLVSLGRVQVSVSSLGAANETTAPETVRLWGLLLVYAAGVLTLLVSIVRGWRGDRGVVRRATCVTDPRLLDIADEARATLRIRRRIPLMVTTELHAPVACGVWRPVVLLPHDTQLWSDGELRAVVLHELAHVKARDIAFALIARVASALYWFHPGAWLVAHALHEDCERACDDRVLGAGVRPSDYAALLADAAERSARGVFAAASFTGGRRRHRGLRGRLAAIVDQRRRRASPSRAVVFAAALSTFTIGLATSVAQLAPTRDVLTRLMRDEAWESRAYAVIGLARRADSLAVVRTAAALDPSPRVRAMAEAALHLR